MSYAENTTVPIERSKNEIERVLLRYGAEGFMYGITPSRAVVQFKAHDRVIRFILPMPDASDDSYTKTPTGRDRKGQTLSAAYEQEVRRRWRALALAIKAKLEAVETGIAEFEDEFLAQIVMPNGQTVSEMARPVIDKAYKTGKTVPLLTFMGEEE